MEPSFEERLVLERKRLGQTQVEFGQMGGVSRLAQWKYEHGENIPTIEYLEKLRDSKVDVIYLITGHRLSSQNIDWNILRDAFILIYQMVAQRPGKNYSPEQLFDLFKHLWQTMMTDAYGTETQKEDCPSSCEVSCKE